MNPTARFGIGSCSSVAYLGLGRGGIWGTDVMVTVERTAGRLKQCCAAFALSP